ncbi:MAG TPA: hypothetical protein VMZ06_01045 [Candidatus Bathyarchaeia archaeon]|nr:hypothetical protein [Candidatus Bathyarchaeia archaeon]
MGATRLRSQSGSKHAPAGSHRFYDVNKFTPEQVRKDDAIPWRTTKLFYGAERRTVRYKEIDPVYSPGGARNQPVRRIIVAPTAYRKRKSGRYSYGNPAYLLTTDLAQNAKTLLQIYFNRRPFAACRTAQFPATKNR